MRMAAATHRFIVRGTSVLTVTLGLAFSAAHAHATELDQWLQAQTVHSAQAMLANIGPSAAVPDAALGAVVASPAYSPNYRYHWVRDGALVMDTLIGLYERSQNNSEKARFLKIFFEYVDFSRRIQLTPNRSGEPDGMGLGEPKFNVDGSAYNDEWGRPQNDGPALRASTMTRFAHLLLDQGQEEFVRQKLYDSVLPTHSAIKADLEYVAHHWRDFSFDLWEEVRGAHFYTRMVQRRALLEGAALAERLGDSGAAGFYRAQAQALEGEIANHWDSRLGLIKVTLDWSKGINYKSSALDVAVVLGALHGTVRNGAGSAFFGVTDDRVLATAIKLQDAFRRMYRINARDKDLDNQPMGAGIGRYPEDRYSGGSSDQGNAWFLATNAYAELYYRCANTWESEGRIPVTSVNALLFRKLKLFGRGQVVAQGETLESSDPRFTAVIRGLRQSGDDYLRRVRFHADASGALSEQFDRDSGYMESAEQLTWSHASLLTAAWARAEH
jgi:glucoamylase